MTGGPHSSHSPFHSQGKLDAFRKLLADGETLNEDQKNAVSRYEDVLLNLEFFRDFEKSVQKINDEVSPVLPLPV